jgi:hypothetical protein
VKFSADCRLRNRVLVDHLDCWLDPALCTLINGSSVLTRLCAPLPKDCLSLLAWIQQEALCLLSLCYFARYVADADVTVEARHNMCTLNSTQQAEVSVGEAEEGVSVEKLNNCLVTRLIVGTVVSVIWRASRFMRPEVSQACRLRLWMASVLNVVQSGAPYSANRPLHHTLTVLQMRVSMP